MYKPGTYINDRSKSIRRHVLPTIFYHSSRAYTYDTYVYLEISRPIRQEIYQNFPAKLIIKFDLTIKERVSDYDYVPFEQSIVKDCLVRIA